MQRVFPIPSRIPPAYYVHPLDPRLASLHDFTSRAQTSEPLLHQAPKAHPKGRIKIAQSRAGLRSKKPQVVSLCAPPTIAEELPDCPLPTEDLHSACFHSPLRSTTQTSLPCTLERVKKRNLWVHFFGVLYADSRILIFFQQLRPV